MFRAKIRIHPETAKNHGLSEDSVFEVFFNAPNLVINQLSEADIEESFVPAADDECEGCHFFCKAQGRCILEQD